jgi:SAM-dependent methyltransferase
MRPQAYDAFSRAYRAAGFGLFSIQISRRLAHAWAKSLPKGAWIADLGCGDGGAEVAFKKAGLRTIGIDLSPGMLALHPGLRVQADMRNLPLRPVFSGIICLYDALNHLPPGDTAAFFDSVACLLRPGGRFAFDANTLEGSTMWVDEDCVIEKPNVELTIRSTFDEASLAMTNRIAGWVRQGRTTLPVDETVHEWYHPLERIDQELVSAGFTLVDETPLFMDEDNPEVVSKWLFEYHKPF